MSLVHQRQAEFLFTNNAAAAATKSLQSCLTLCDPIDGSPLTIQDTNLLK